MEIRTIKCDVKGCNEQMMEPKHGDGFKEWGSVGGRANSETGEVAAHLCPKHLDTVFEFIETGDKP